VSRFLLEARNLRLSRGSVRVLQGVSLGIHRGELGVVLGPSGSGKSSLLKALAGIYDYSGEVLLEGRQVSGLATREVASTIGMVPQDDIIHTKLELRPALEYSARLRLPPEATEDDVQAAVDRVLKATELEERAGVRIGRLSGGQRKRASMGVELLLAPPVLLLDEPTSGLDPELESSTMALLRRLAREGRAVLTTTHATASLGVADFLLVIVAGYLAWLGPPDAALKHFGVSDPDLIFKKLRDLEPRDWGARYAASATATRMAARPAPAIGAAK